MRTKNGNGKEIRIFVDGSGQGPNEKPSGFAYVREDTREKKVERLPGLTSNQAEYRGLIFALKEMPAGSRIEALMDSLLVVSQLRGEYRIIDRKLATLAAEVKTIVEQRKLNLTVMWIPRNENRAGKLL